MTPAYASTDGTRQATRAPTLLLAVACGVAAANIYYLQPLTASVAASVGLREGAAGLIATMTQAGYGVGLLLVLPLGDLIENRRLIGVLSVLSVGALLIAATSASAATLLPAAFAIGIGAVTVQLAVVYAAHLAHEADRGRVIGFVTAGLMLGIMLSRPVASALAGFASWRAPMLLAAFLNVMMTVGLRLVLPPRLPTAGQRYGELLASLPGTFVANRIVRWRTAIHVGLFFGFGVFWTAVPLILRNRFHLSEKAVAVFLLTGIASVVAAPLAGWLADRGHARMGGFAAILSVGVGFGFAMLGAVEAAGLFPLVVAAVFIGAGITAHAVFAQRDVFAAPEAVRARLNGMFMAAYFTAGALGSAIAVQVYLALQARRRADLTRC